ncbi:hypothetical protein OAM04_00255 [bacterium]|nr:hypothetical protein [bacterium]
MRAACCSLRLLFHSTDGIEVLVGLKNGSFLLSKIYGSVSSLDSNFGINVRALGIPNSKFNLKITQKFRLRNDTRKHKRDGKSPQFMNSLPMISFPSIGHGGTKTYLFKIDTHYWKIGLFFFLITAIAFWIERKICQRRLNS